MISNIENGTLADWKNVLVDTENKLINESDVQVYNTTDVVDTSSGFGLGATSQNTYGDLAALLKSPTTINRDKKIATFEWNFWVLDGSFDCIDDVNNEKIKGWVTDNISDESCYLQEYMYLYNIPSTAKKQMHTVKFNPAYGFVPENVFLYSNGINIQYDLEAMADNDYIETAQYIYLNYPRYAEMDDTMFFTIRDTNLPYRRGRVTEWNLGFEFYIDKYDLQDFEHSRTCKLNMTELPQNDVTMSFADKFGYLDPLKVNQAYKHTFNKTDEFRVYYGYNLDNGWSYALVETLLFSEIEVDRDSIKTTIKLESPINRWTGNYSTRTMDSDSWTTLGGLLSKLYLLATNIGGGIPNQSLLNLVNTVKGYWRPLLHNICKDGNGDFVNTPLNELIQQAVAFGNGFLLRTENNWTIKKYVNADGKIASSITPATPDDTVRAENCLTFPIVENLEKYKQGVFESNSYSGQDADIKVTPTGASYTLLPYRKTEQLISSGTNKDFIAHNDILVIGYENSSGEWQWTDNAHLKYLWYITTFDCGERVEVEGILNPLIQLGDIIKIFTSSEYADYQGIVEEITITYDGSFRGKIVINRPYVAS